jgi:hypothetical protein
MATMTGEEQGQSDRARVRLAKGSGAVDASLDASLHMLEEAEEGRGQPAEEEEAEDGEEEEVLAEDNGGGSGSEEGGEEGPPQFEGGSVAGSDAAADLAQLHDHVKQKGKDAWRFLKKVGTMWIPVQPPPRRVRRTEGWGVVGWGGGHGLGTGGRGQPGHMVTGAQSAHIPTAETVRLPLRAPYSVRLNAVHLDGD